MSLVNPKYVKKQKKVERTVADLPIVEWSEARPKPVIAPGIWRDVESEEISQYIDWHRRHPHCITPRKNDNPGGMLMGNQVVDEQDPSKYYAPNGVFVKPLTETFLAPRIGTHANFESVSNTARELEYQQKVTTIADYNDPWYEMSVKDHLEQTHIDGSHTTVKRKQPTQKELTEFERKARLLESMFQGYEGGYPTIDRDNANRLVDLALNDKHGLPAQELQRGKVKKGPWTETYEFSKFTKSGSRFNDFKREELQKAIAEALAHHERQEEDDKIRLKYQSRSSKKSRKKLAAEKSSKVAPLPITDTELVQSDASLLLLENSNDTAPVSTLNDSIGKSTAPSDQFAQQSLFMQSSGSLDHSSVVGSKRRLLSMSLFGGSRSISSSSKPKPHQLHQPIVTLGATAKNATKYHRQEQGSVVSAVTANSYDYKYDDEELLDVQSVDDFRSVQSITNKNSQTSSASLNRPLSTSRSRDSNPTGQNGGRKNANKFLNGSIASSRAQHSRQSDSVTAVGRFQPTDPRSVGSLPTDVLSNMRGDSVGDQTLVIAGFDGSVVTSATESPGQRQNLSLILSDESVDGGLPTNASVFSALTLENILDVPASTRQSVTTLPPNNASVASAIGAELDMLSLSQASADETQLSLVSANSSAMDPYDVMAERLGGDKRLDKMVDDWTKLAVKVEKKAKVKKAQTNVLVLDLVEACDKLRIVKAAAILASGQGDPDMNTYEDIPLFLHMFQKAIRMDLVTGNLQPDNQRKDGADRKKLQRILDLLAMNGADINTLEGKDGYAPVHLAARGENVKLINWLLEHKAKFNLASKFEKFTPLMFAAKNGNVRVAAEMLRRGVSVDYAVKDTGNTALHVAASFGQTRFAQFMLRIGADKMLRNTEGLTAAGLAEKCDYMVTAQAISAFATPKHDLVYHLSYLHQVEVDGVNPHAEQSNSLLSLSQRFLKFPFSFSDKNGSNDGSHDGESSALAKLYRSLRKYLQGPVKENELLAGYDESMEDEGDELQSIDTNEEQNLSNADHVQAFEPLV